MQGNSPDEEYADPHGECRHEIDRLCAALLAARNRIDDDTETINRQVAELVLLRAEIAKQPTT